MQARKVTDDDTKDALNSSKTRVQSMSILHQNLYQEDNLKDVDVASYVDKLIGNIIDTYHVNENIKVQIDVDPIVLDIDTLVPLGLMANELVCNAVKHAFKGREAGELNISLKDIGESIVLTVSDDGVGFEGEELPIRAGSLGARLIKSRLSLLQILQFFIWGSWFVTGGTYMLETLNFTGRQVGWVYTNFSIAATVTPLFMGVLADRLFAAEKLLAVLHLLGGALLFLASNITDFAWFNTVGQLSKY